MKRIVMEILEFKKGVKTAVSILIILILCLSCAPKLAVEKTLDYEINRYKTEWATYLNVTVINSLDLPIYKGYVNINGVFIDLDENGFRSQKVQPGLYHLETGFISHKYSRIKNLKLSQGDSVHVTIKLEPDTSDLH